MITLKEFLEITNPKTLIKVEMSEIQNDDVIMKGFAEDLEADPRTKNMIVDFLVDTTDGIRVFCCKKQIDDNRNYYLIEISYTDEATKKASTDRYAFYTSIEEALQLSEYLKADTETMGYENVKAEIMIVESARAIVAKKGEANESAD